MEDKKLKIVYLLRFWPVFGGGETVTRTLANEMCKRGHEVYVIYLWKRTNDTEVYLESDLNEICINNISNVKDGSILKSEYQILEKELKKRLYEIKPDYIINQWLPTKVVAKSIKNLDTILIKCHHSIIKYVPNIVTLKQKIFYSIFGDKAGWLRVYPECRQDYLYSDAWVFLSEASKRDAKYLIRDAKNERMHVITNPLPYTVDSSEIDLTKKKKEVIYVGRVVELKRVWYLLESWKMIQDKVPDWSFRIIGDGTYLEEEKKKANELGVKRVQFEGFRDSKEFMKNASILMMASSQEGFAMVIIEAQQCGCVPIVVDSFPTVHDIIDNGRNGLLVENNNISKYAEVLLKTIIDDEFRLNIAVNAINDCKRFSVEDICDQWEAFLPTVKKYRKRRF